MTFPRVPASRRPRVVRPAIAAVLLALAFSAAAHAGSIKRTVFADLERNVDGRLLRAIPDDAFVLLGNTRGFYLEKYGAVFTTEINLANTPTVSPFRQTIPKEDVVKVRNKKLQRITVLKQHMRSALLALAVTLDDVPLDEQIVLGVALFYFSWEDTAGLPSQVLMQAEKRKLVEVQTGRAGADSVIQVREF